MQIWSIDFGGKVQSQLMVEKIVFATNSLKQLDIYRNKNGLPALAGAAQLVGILSTMPEVAVGFLVRTHSQALGSIPS